MFNLVTMRQGQQESDNSFNKCLYANLHKLDLEGGRNIELRKYIMERAEDDPTDKEVKLEEENV